MWKLRKNIGSTEPEILTIFPFLKIMKILDDLEQSSQYLILITLNKIYCHKVYKFYVDCLAMKISECEK